MTIKSPIKFKLTKIDYSSLIADRNHHGQLKASLGKISFWLVLLPAMWIWLATPLDVKSSHKEVLVAVVAYNLMKKSPWFGGVNKIPPPMGRDEEDDDLEYQNRPARFRQEEQ